MRKPQPWYWEQRDCWCVQHKGKRVRLAAGKDNKELAYAEFYRIMAAQGVDVPVATMSAADVFAAFLEHTEAAVARDERAQSTLDGYQRYLSSAAATFGQVRASDLKPKLVTDWTQRGTPAWNETTRANAITACKAAFAWAAEGGLIPSDPIASLSKPTRRRRKAVMSDDQVKAVLAATEETPFADLVLALWESGCRPGEVTTLTAGRADPDAGTWIVRNKTLRKTGQATRTVYLTPPLVELTRRLLARAEGPDALLFVNARGRPWTRNAQACAWRRLRDKLGLGPEATSYAIRHRYAIEALRSGVDPSEAAALMGHTDVNMLFAVYGHWDEQHERLRGAAGRVRKGKGGED